MALPFMLSDSLILSSYLCHQCQMSSLGGRCTIVLISLTFLYQYLWEGGRLVSIHLSFTLSRDSLHFVESSFFI